MKNSLIVDAIRTSRKLLTRHPEYSNRGFIHFSFVVQNNKILEYGYNLCGTPPKHYGYPERSKIHSEIKAWIRARGLLNDSEFEIINIRLNRQGKIRMSKPCEYCFELLSELGCKYFYYTTNEGEVKVI